MSDNCMTLNALGFSRYLVSGLFYVMCHMLLSPPCTSPAISQRPCHADCRRLLQMMTVVHNRKEQFVLLQRAMNLVEEAEAARIVLQVGVGVLCVDVRVSVSQG